MTKVITYGTFDLLHIGHVHLLGRARALGTSLVVGVSTEAFNAQKEKEAVYPFEERRQIVAALRDVDEVIAEHSWEQKIHDITTLGVDVFVMGSDWTGHFDFLKAYCDVVYLPRTEGVSTATLKSGLRSVPTSGLPRR